MQVAVIGGGVIGVCTAYYLAEAGHEVTLVERHGNVAEQASFGNAGIVASAYAAPWAMPGMPGKFLSYLFKKEAPVLFRPSLEPALWRWMGKWLSECDLQRYRINRNRMQRMAAYSNEVLRHLRDRRHFDYEQTRGYLQLYRSERDVALAKPLHDLLNEYGIPHGLLDADEARCIEPALSVDSHFSAALHLSEDETGNCSLFTKQLKQTAQSLGVKFQFGSAVKSIAAHERGVDLMLEDRTISADAVVVAAGVDSVPLLAPLGIQVPLYPVKGYSATVGIKNFDQAPVSALMDEAYKVAISRMGNRIRIAGLADFGSRSLEMRESALLTLIKIGDDWFPQAANYRSAQFWCGTRPMLPDGPPLLGATPARNVYLNIGHGPTGWSMAAGSGKLVADIISGREPDIDMEGLTLLRFQR